MFQALGSAAGDIFGGMAAKESGEIKAEAMRIRARGTLSEAENYDRSSALALENRDFTEMSTAIQAQQKLRETAKVYGGQQADIAGAGFAEGGSALDILRETASQGALARAMIEYQGEIAEHSYDEQAKSYELMAKTGRETAASEMALAQRVEELGEKEATAKYISAGFKVAGAVASFGMPGGGGGGGFEVIGFDSAGNANYGRR